MVEKAARGTKRRRKRLAQSNRRIREKVNARLAAVDDFASQDCMPQGDADDSKDLTVAPKPVKVSATAIWTMMIAVCVIAKKGECSMGWSESVASLPR